MAKVERVNYFYWEVEFFNGGSTSSHVYATGHGNYRGCQSVTEAKESALKEFARLWVESSGAKDIRVFEQCEYCMGNGEISLTTGKRVKKTTLKRCPACRGKDSRIQHI